MAAMDTVEKRNAGVGATDMNTSTPAVGRRGRTPMDAIDTGEAPAGNTGKRPRGDALEMAVATDLGVAKEHAQ